MVPKHGHITTPLIGIPALLGGIVLGLAGASTTVGAIFFGVLAAVGLVAVVILNSD